MKGINMIEQLMLVGESKYSFAQTVAELSEKILASGWRMPAQHDLQENVRKIGGDILPVKVIEVCRPDYAAKILSVDSLRVFSPLMPCRISVYEESDGKVYIARMNSGLLASQIGGIIEEVMGKAFNEMEDLLKDFLK